MSLETIAVDLRPIQIQRIEVGRSSPTPEEQLYIWSQLTVPQTPIRKETGGYTPFSIPRQAHFHPARTKLVMGGIRGSKSVSEAMQAISWAPHSDLLWLGAESYDDTRQEFEYYMEAALSLGWTENALISFPMNKYQPCSLETYWGTLLETKSLADKGSLMARAPDWIGLCEPGKTDINSYKRALERLSTWRGELFMAGTTENTSAWLDEFWTKWKRFPNVDHAKSWTSPTYINKVIYPGGAKDPEIRRLLNASETFEEFLQRIVGVPSAQPDIIMGKHFRPRVHVGQVQFSRKDDHGQWRPVYLAIDPGYGGESRYVVLAIQIIGNKIRIIDEVAVKGRTHPEVRKMCMVREWWPVAHNGTIDPYAGESHVYGGISVAQAWRADEDGLGKVFLETPQRLNVEDLIKLVQAYLTGMLGYYIEIDERCQRLQEEMRMWKRIRATQGMGLPSKANCDAIKALGYFLTHHSRGLIGKTGNEPTPSFAAQPYGLRGYASIPDRLMAEVASREEEMEEWLGL